VRIAHAYRDQFHKDVLVDLVGYRRWGHNESDEPAFTQPHMYEIVRSHPTVRELLVRQLKQEGLVSEREAEEMVKEAWVVLEQAKKEADSGLCSIETSALGSTVSGLSMDTPPAVSMERLMAYNQELLAWPPHFTPHAKLARILQRRSTAVGAGGGIDWGQAEALAFATILVAGIPIRLTGQDAERGTFSHRNAVLHSIEREGERYIPLQHLIEAKAAFSIYNSPLSEIGVLGFEYGYSVRAPETLVLWEAQFGDFANVAQVIIDQFIASGRAKWKQDSAIVLLLPHGYEGQGPEHSSARLERYLQLAAQDNWRVANCSTVAQYYHLLRQQAYNVKRHPRPLVIMTPKALLRHPLSSSCLQDLAEGHFQPVIDDVRAREQSERIQRVIFCAGKIAIDLLAHESRMQNTDIAIVRVEMLYPFPDEEVRHVLERYKRAKEVVWVQEEPRNMGAWNYVSPVLAGLVSSGVTLDLISRPDRASPEVGFWDLYEAEQEKILKDATSLPLRQFGGKYVH
jgi:2-oxoglutarate dehydrogenase E1 component